MVNDASSSQGKRDESTSVEAAKAKAEAKVIPPTLPEAASCVFVKPHAGFDPAPGS